MFCVGLVAIAVPATSGKSQARAKHKGGRWAGNGNLVLYETAICFSKKTKPRDDAVIAGLEARVEAGYGLGVSPMRNTSCRYPAPYWP